jgi:hypothetical protein
MFEKPINSIQMLEKPKSKSSKGPHPTFLFTKHGNIFQAIITYERGRKKFTRNFLVSQK